MRKIAWIDWDISILTAAPAPPTVIKATDETITIGFQPIAGLESSEYYAIVNSISSEGTTKSHVFPCNIQEHTCLLQQLRLKTAYSIRMQYCLKKFAFNNCSVLSSPVVALTQPFGKALCIPSEGQITDSFAFNSVRYTWKLTIWDRSGCH